MSILSMDATSCQYGILFLMPIHLPLFEDKTMLPTGKYHVSFSEVSTNHECGWKHKLKYVDGHVEGDTEHTLYGKLIHAALQDWLILDKSVWFDWDERIKQCHQEVVQAFKCLGESGFNPGEDILLRDWLDPIDGILQKVPAWMDETFPGWKPYAAELQLFEPVLGQKNKWFKGFIDAIITIPKTPRKGAKKPVSGNIYWLLDWKTTSWGWDKSKKQDKFKRMQLALYKNYFHTLTGIPLEDIRCGFVLLKRTTKKGEYCELIDVSVGPETIKHALDTVALSINLIAKRYWLKNRNSCRFCDFKGTALCP